MTNILKKTKSENQLNIDKNLLKKLLNALSDQGIELFGQDGLFEQLKKSLVNEILEAEMEHHLDMENMTKH